MKKFKLVLLAATLVIGSQARATLFDIIFTGGSISGSGEIDQATAVGGGIYQATSGTFTISSLGPTFVFQIDPVPARYTDVTIHGVADTGGADLYGDNKLGQNYISGDGLVFTYPQTTVNGNGFNGDVINLWGNGGGSYTLAFGGPDFPAGLTLVNGTATIADPVPEPTTMIAGALLLLPFGASTLRMFRRRTA